MKADDAHSFQTNASGALQMVAAKKVKLPEFTLTEKVTTVPLLMTALRNERGGKLSTG